LVPVTPNEKNGSAHGNAGGVGRTNVIVRQPLVLELEPKLSPVELEPKLSPVELEPKLSPVELEPKLSPVEPVSATPVVVPLVASLVLPADPVEPALVPDVPAVAAVVVVSSSSVVSQPGVMGMERRLVRARNFFRSIRIVRNSVGR